MVVNLILIFALFLKLLIFCKEWPKTPPTSSLNIAFTEHITNALIKAREEKIKLEVSIPRNLADGWDPVVKIKLHNFPCFALCNVGASASVMPKRMYDMLDLKPFDPCYFYVCLVDSSVKKPLGRIDDVLIVVNDNYVPVDFLVMDIECDPSCPIILERPFLRTVGDVIDMKEGNIKFKFPLKRAWNTSLERRLSYHLRPLYGQAIPLILIKLDLIASCLAQMHKRKLLLGGNPQCFYFQF